MKKFNLKKLSKSMSLRNKANIIFADFNRQSETRGKERLITPEEEEAIYEDCQLKHQIPEINRLTDCFNVIRRCVVDSSMRVVLLDLQLSRLSVIILRIFIDQRTRRDSPPEKISKKLFSYWFEPLESEDEDYEPNVDFQHAFARALQAYRLLRKSLYMVEVLEQKGRDIQFLNDELREMIKDANSKRAEFEEMGTFGPMIGIYKKADEMELIRKSGFSVPEFEEYFFYPEKALELTEQEKEECKKTIHYWLENI
ncbi:hypothetical protein HN709_03880 [Candidatus Peregrinibacteria bacterium]|jgi:hypothetical protein|nr:hypothetical protein [Candidatus Peregrinibacteria bacterium]MBT7736805.1 hypothetical protein [Candidatus Peregrinibacteria bacterium]